MEGELDSPRLLDENQRLTTSPQSKLQLPEDTTLEDSQARAQLRLGLFSYPVLQAADILVHRYAACANRQIPGLTIYTELLMFLSVKIKGNILNSRAILPIALIISMGQFSPSQRL